MGNNTSNEVNAVNSISDSRHEPTVVRPARATAGERSRNRKSFDELQASRGPKTKAAPTSSENEKPINELTKLAFEDWLYVRLTKYLDDIEEEALPVNIPKDEREDVTDAADEFVGFLFHEMEQIDRRMKVPVHDIRRIGNFYIDLEVVTVETLHFEVTIDDLSDDNVTEWVAESVHNDEVFSVYLTDTCGVRWSEMVDESTNGKNKLKGDIGLATTFHDRIVKALEIVKSKNRATLHRKTGRLVLVPETCVTKRGIETVIKFSWKNEHRITLMFTPVIRSKAMSKFKQSDVVSKLIFDHVTSSGMLFLRPIPSSEDHFQYTFEYVENEILKTMKPNHQRLYKISKYLVQGPNRTAVADAEYFTDHVIRQLVIYHDDRCPLHDQLADCLMALIDDMQKLIKLFKHKKRVFFPNCFHTNMNNMSSPCRAMNTENLTITLAGLEHIANHLINDVGCTPLYSFREAIRHFVPLNEFVLKRDYLNKKYGMAKQEAKERAVKRELVDAVGNRRFAVKFH